LHDSSCRPIGQVAPYFLLFPAPDTTIPLSDSLNLIILDAHVS
jgi:hypothetical protein